MAAPVYSTRFLCQHDAAVGVDYTFVVPAGFVAVVREITAYYGGAADVDFKALSSVGPTVFYRESFSLALAGWRQYSGRFVAQAGESLIMQVGDTMDITMSGYLLSST